MPLYHSKTFWTGVAALIGAAGAWFTGEADAFQAAQMALTGLAAIFLRHGMARQ